MVQVLLGHSEPGPRLQRNIHGLRAAMGRVRQRLWRTVPESTDALWDAVGEAPERATRPSDGSRTLCLQCGSVGPCLPTRPNCPRDHLHRFPIALRTPDQLVALRSAIIAELPQLSSVVQPLPDVTLAQAYLILELWTTAFQQLVTDSRPTFWCPRPSGLAPSYLPSSPHTTTLRCVRQGASAHWSCPCSPGCPRRNDGRSKPSTALGRPRHGFPLMSAHAVTCRGCSARCRLLPWSPRTPSRRAFGCVALCRRAAQSPVSWQSAASLCKKVGRGAPQYPSLSQHVTSVPRPYRI